MASLATMISEMAQGHKVIYITNVMTSLLTICSRWLCLLRYWGKESTFPLLTSFAVVVIPVRVFFNGFVVDSCIVVFITAVSFLYFKEPLMERYFVFYNAKPLLTFLFSLVSLLQSTSVSSLAATGSLFTNGPFLLLVFFTVVYTPIFGA